MFEKYTERARKVMALARQEAQRLNSDFIGTEHVLLAILSEGGGVASKVLENLSVDQTLIRLNCESIVPQSDSIHTRSLGDLPFSPRVKRVLELAGDESSRMSVQHIGTEHLLIAMFLEGESTVFKILSDLGLTLEQVRSEAKKVMGILAPPANATDQLEAKITEAIRRWSKQPDVACFKCGDIGSEPMSVMRDPQGMWHVGRHTPDVPGGWLQVIRTSLDTRLLCTACSKTMNLL